MICDWCAAGADNMTDYRERAQVDDRRRVEAGEKPLTAVNARRWIEKRARLSLVLHCKGERPGCSCQCDIPELRERTP
jgi:hypothetical protein